jgi:hypothetical protein
MKSRFLKLCGAAVLLAAVLLWGCSPNETPPNTPEPPNQTTTPGENLTGTPPPPAEHHIAIRQVDGVGEFYNSNTGETFVPRGANYVFVPDGDQYETELLRVGLYDPQRTRDDFTRLAGLGYNTVRVFLDHCSVGPNCISRAGQPGLNPAYLDNIADMTLAARQAGIYILFTSNDLPDGGGYSEEANRSSGDQFAGYRNSYYLTPPAISATRRYWADLLTGLVDRRAAFDAVLGWQLLNEQWMFSDQPPLSLTGDTVETTTGSYDMSDPQQKEQMVSDGLVYYIAQMKEEILAHDPTALVTMGFFAPEVVAPGWYDETASLLEKSELDFFDFHAYPGEVSLADQAAAFGMLDYNRKPIILGEYGAFRGMYPELESGTRAVTEWQAESCQYGFDGWLYWSYYPNNLTVGDTTWGLTDQDGYLLDLFAPANQPDPCSAIEIPHSNLAYGKPVRASRYLSDQLPEYAVDENGSTQWGSGAVPAQWIEIDLEGSFRVTEVRLLVSQYPAGATTHLLQVQYAGTDSYVTVYEFSGPTGDNDILTFTPETPLENVTHIRVQTTSSPSWVSWKEITVLGEELTP